MGWAHTLFQNQPPTPNRSATSIQRGFGEGRGFERTWGLISSLNFCFMSVSEYIHKMGCMGRTRWSGMNQDTTFFIDDDMRWGKCHWKQSKQGTTERGREMQKRLCFVSQQGRLLCLTHSRPHKPTLLITRLFWSFDCQRLLQYLDQQPLNSILKSNEFLV